MPGPTLRVKRGEELRVRLVNELPEPTTIHWHGLRLPNAMDGVPLLTQPPIAPGASFDYRFRPPDAGTFLYHAYLAEQSERGLDGALTVEEPAAVGVDRDIVLLLTPAPAGDGPAVRVNGALRPDIAVKRGERLRLRLINASAARGLFLKLDGHVPGDGDRRPAGRAIRCARQPRRTGAGRSDRSVHRHDRAPAAAPLLAALLTGAKKTADRAAGLREWRRGPRPIRTRPRCPPIPSRRTSISNSLKVELLLANAKPIDPPGAPLFTVKRGRAVTLAIRNSRSAPRHPPARP